MLSKFHRRRGDGTMKRKQPDETKTLTVGQLIEKLKKYPKEKLVEVMGHWSGPCRDWEAGFSEEIEIEDIENDNTIYISGNIWWR